jgi:tetratricopeptide (TPR) repeat protein
VFRDRDELPTAGDLSSTIREALSESDALIVICSPAAARSQWVDAEVRAFMAQGRTDRIFCFIVEGDPAVDNCLSPATIEDGRIPLAADARPEGDGKDRAFLKLVAGMTVTSGLAITAHVARNDAQRRQAQAEDLLGFMLGDLRKKLTTVGRLDLMRTVDDKATTYFAELDPRDLNDRALEEQARSLTGIGQVRMEENRYAEAMRAFQQAYARTTARAARDPSNGQRLFDRAQAEYWIGNVAWQQNKFDEAERWLQRYRASAEQLAAMDRDNFDWQKEVAYAHQNLAILADARGDHEGAERAMKRGLELFRGWVKQRPNDTQLRSEESTIVSWLGTNAETQKRYDDAETWFLTLLGNLDTLRKQEPDNANRRKEWIDAQLLLTQTRFKRGDFAGARAASEAANREADALVKQDPTNRLWLSQQGIGRYWRAQLTGLGQPREAMPIAQEAERMLASIVAAEPTNKRVVKWLDDTRVLEAQLSKPAVATR